MRVRRAADRPTEMVSVASCTHRNAPVAARPEVFGNIRTPGVLSCRMPERCQPTPFAGQISDPGGDRQEVKHGRGAPGSPGSQLLVRCDWLHHAAPYTAGEAWDASLPSLRSGALPLCSLRACPPSPFPEVLPASCYARRHG